MAELEQAQSIAIEPAGRSDARRRGERRCLVTGDVRPRGELMRFVVGPDDRVVPDLDARLPGRGLWLTGRRDIVAEACAKRAFARGAKRNVAPMTGPGGESLDLFVEQSLRRRALDALAMARKAGAFVAGFEKVRAALSAHDAGEAVLLCASDAGDDGRAKLARLAARSGDVVRVDEFDAGQLGAAAGRDHAVHAFVLPGGAARHVLETVRAYTAYRGDAAPSAGTDLMD
ncbi:MAG: RNA-binding protein [Rhodospirillaceae bacterium]